jgi:hypothetical protein
VPPEGVPLSWLLRLRLLPPARDNWVGAMVHESFSTSFCVWDTWM